MTCRDVSEQDLAEKYLLGALSEEEQDAFEEHYFSCERSFEGLRILRRVREELLRGARTGASLVD